jgi:short-subunit dehydrogenase
LARRGGNVIAVSRTLSNLESLQTEIQNEGGKCSIYNCDFEKPDEVKTTIERALEANQVDLLVNNAGKIR